MRNNIERKRLGDLVDVLNGYAFKSQEYVASGYQVIRIANVQDGYITNSSPKYTNISEKYLDRFILNEGDLLMSLTGNVGRVGFVTKANLPAVLNQRVAKIIIKNESIDARYLYYYLKNGSTRKYLENKSKGIAQKNIGSEDIKKLEIFLPSLAEQKRIVKELDQVNSLIEKRKKTVDLLDGYLKSLFLDMFGDLFNNTKNWEFVDFEEYIELLTDYHSNGSYESLRDHVTLLSEPDYALMVRTTDLENNDFTKKVNYISKSAYEFLHKSKVFGDEIIINKIGSAGKVYLMPKLNRPVSLGMNAFLLRFKKGNNPKFIYYLLNSSYGNEIIQKKVKGAVTKTIRKDAIRSLRVPKVHIELQEKFVRNIELVNSIQALMKRQLEDLVAYNNYLLPTLEDNLDSKVNE